MFRGGIDALKFGGAVAHLHDGHAAAAPVEKFLADAFEDRKRKRRRTRVEIENALGGACADGCVAHDVVFLFRWAFGGCGGGLAFILTFQNSRCG